MTGPRVTPTLGRMAYDNFLVDKRVVERNIKKGLVDPEALRQQIDGLPDRESNCVHVSLEGGAQAAAPESSDAGETADTGADLGSDDEGLDDEDDEQDEDDDDDDEASADESQG